MRLLFTILLFLFATSFLRAQHKVRFIVREKTSIPHDSLYITGSFNNWDSTPNPAYHMQPSGPHEKWIVLNLEDGKIQYKFHRGSWFTVEKQYEGYEVPNRVVTITKDTILQDSIVCYRDEILKEKWYALTQPQPDTARIRLLASIASVYSYSEEYHNLDSAFFYIKQALIQLQKIKPGKELSSWNGTGYASYYIDLQEMAAELLHSLGNYSKALELRLENLKLAQQQKDNFLMLKSIRNIIEDYSSMKDYPNVLVYSKQMQTYIHSVHFPGHDAEWFQWAADEGRADAYFHLHLIDSSLYYAKRLYQSLDSNLNYKNRYALVNQILGDIYSQKEDKATAIAYYRTAISYALQSYQYPVLSRTMEGLAKLFQQQGKIDSALHYALMAMNVVQNNAINVQAWGENTNSYIADISPLVASLYNDKHQPDSAYKYLRLSADLKDSLYNVDRVRQFQNITFNETIRQQQQAQEEREAQQRYKNGVRVYALVAGLLTLLIIAFLLFRNNQQKQKANELLQKQKEEIDIQRAKAENALTDLKVIQKQLIQAEKMASLGELTAGIAHEIQNPLNFVNNFSDVNNELIDEMKEALDSNNTGGAITVSDEIKQNNLKINHHGKRADAIVKGMLQHSRNSTGKKEPTDINSLADEYLRLAYHGLRAKDKEFNAAIQTHFDKSIGKVDIVPQNIGRVLLNLFNNAFYAVNEKKKGSGDSYEPIVSITTKKLNDKVEIIIKDNGSGIPQKNIDKIFQPFFTTKPTGEGTGLGLSLSYDIVKSHGGELKVNSVEGEGAAFSVYLPDE